jgi:solute carrier family 25 (mitochondrial S-adenosylmethionine transporter), member 26
MDSFLSGAVAGFAVDVSLFPLDTIKTRLQSPQGFSAAGGFRGIYRGLGPAAVGSAPGAAFFFFTYETSKSHLMKPQSSASLSLPLIHMLSASFGEFMACIVRVPTEVVKQNMQASISDTKPRVSHVVKSIVNSPKGIGGFYSGFYATLMREIPFSMIQFPLYEASKSYMSDITRGASKDESTLASAFCGCMTGAFAACLTTPMDVVKTRLMLGCDKNGIPYRGVINTLQRVHAEGGVKSLFAGVYPRTLWIGIGGFIFFGAYNETKKHISNSKIEDRL